MILECPIPSPVIAILSFLFILLFGIFLVEMVCCVRVFSIFRSPNSLLHSSFFALVVDVSRSWCVIGICWLCLSVASLDKESAVSFPSIPWCDGIRVIIIYLWSLASSVYVS